MRFTPLTVLMTFSIGLMTSFSTASGEAPGQRTETPTTGIDTSGICSTGRRA